MNVALFSYLKVVNDGVFQSTVNGMLCSVTAGAFQLHCDVTVSGFKPPRIPFEDRKRDI